MTREVKLIIQVGIILIALLLIKIFYVSPGIISGNGNPALLIIFPLIFVLIWFGLTWLKWLGGLRLNSSTKVKILALSLVLCVSVTIISVKALDQFEVKYKEKFEERYGRSINSDYLKLVTSGITVHTNYLYFNYLTFLGFVSLLSVIGVGYSFIKPNDQEVQFTESQEKIGD